MYSWGDDTSKWRSPGSYDYGSGKRAYTSDPAAANPRSYGRRAAPDMKLVDPKNKEISSDSENPIIVGIDCTGSMSDWPAEIFDRLPLFCQTLAKYKPDVEISFSVIGDATCDDYPLQVADFGKGLELDETLRAFYPEGGGGGQHHESYELWAHYMLNHARTPNATSPFMIILGDESFYEVVDPNQVEHYIGDTVGENVDAFNVWSALKQKYNVFMLHKEYGTGFHNSLDKEIVEQWGTALGEQKVVPLPSKERAVDVAMGLIARNWGHFSDYLDNISSRHGASTVGSVLKSVSVAPVVDKSLDSKLVISTTSKKSKGLI